MADNYLDIGGEDVFPLPVNWRNKPTNLFTITRNLQSFPGTSQAISELNPETPISFEALFSVFTKEEEYDILEFIHSRRGRVVRFWIPFQKQMFVLYESATTGASSLNCINNGSVLSYHGYERIYIKMNNGDIITRWVTNITDDGTKISLTLNTPIDRDIEIGNYIEIGRFLLVRFDSDSFQFKVETNTVFEFSQRFYELVKEYSELVAD